MLLLTAGVHEVLRFIPPLNVSAEEMALGVGIFGEALEAVARKRNLG